MFTVSLPFSPDFGLLLFHHDHLVVLEELYLDVVEGRHRHSFTGRKKYRIHRIFFKRNSCSVNHLCLRAKFNREKKN